MASKDPMGHLQDEASCRICQEYFKDPVIIDCGHIFCQACITQRWDGLDTSFSCPQCRKTVQQRNFQPNRHLANVLEIAKQLHLQILKDAGGESLCGEHQKPIQLFCEEDQTPICRVCDRSQAHRAHMVVPIEKAAQEYKEKIRAHLETLRKDREKLLGFKVTVEGKSQEYLIQIQTERQKIVSEFQQLRKFLEEQKRLLLAQLENLEKKVVKIQNEKVTKLSEEMSCLRELISEMEGNCQKPATNVTLDPDTAHPELVLSADRKRVRWGDVWQDLPDNPERFDADPCVLGCEGFTSGRHCWEVEVGDELFWAVGVARESVRRKGGVSYNPDEGIWAVEQYWWDQYQALTSPATPLPLIRVPRRIRVSLDYEWGQVTFFDADNKAPIFTFPPASFNGERICPWFSVGLETQFRLSP